MKRNWKLAIIMFAIFYFSASLFQNMHVLVKSYHGYKPIIISVNVLFLLVSVILLIKYLKAGEALDLIKKIRTAYHRIKIPAKLKFIFVIVLLLQMAHIFIARTNYPFSDVGMWRKGTRSSNYNKEVLSAKYYYNNKRGEVEIFDIRKEHIPFLRKYKDLNFDQLWTNGPAFNKAGYELNYNFLKLYFSNYTDTLKIGIHKYNFDTGEESFITDVDYVKRNKDNLTFFLYHPLFSK